MQGAGSVVLGLASTLAVLAGGGCAARQGGPEAMGGATPEAASSAASPPSPCGQPLPSEALAVPPGNGRRFQLQAEGVQIYTCTSTATGEAWVLTAPEAALTGPDGRPAGRHYAGPTWEALDGSRVAGARVAGATPDPTAIPWLLLKATSHGGTGRMEKVAFVQRVATRGGLAPTGGCGATTVGTVARVPYSASYCFAEAD